MKLHHITNVFFDLDHTLYDFERNSALTFSAVFKQLNIENIEGFMEAFRPINDAFWERYTKDEITHDELRYGRLRESFNKIGQTIEEDQIRYISDYFVEHLPANNLLFEGALEILEYLRPKYRLHIITNGPSEVQKRKMKNAALDSYFVTVTNSEAAGVKKPHPAIFEYALTLSNADKQNSIMIGDSIKADVLGALDAGLDAIYFNEYRQKHEYNFKEINDLSQLKKYL